VHHIIVISVPSSLSSLACPVTCLLIFWREASAAVYRALNSLDDDFLRSGRGTAVVIQEMVFGNMNDQSCTGNAFSRDPESGDRVVTGEYIRLGQGGDVHRGLAPASGAGGNSLVSLEFLMDWGATSEKERRTGGRLYQQLLDVIHRLEKLFHDVQQVEFTVQDGTLFVLRSAPASRTPQASIKFAFQLASEGIISERTALMSLDARAMSCLDRSASLPIRLPEMSSGKKGVGGRRKGQLLGAGLAGVSSGVVSGRAVFSAEAAKRCYEANQACILIQNDSSVDDMETISLADGVISLEGGTSCFLVEISRPLQRTCVVGVGGVYGWSLRSTSPNIYLTPQNERSSQKGCGLGVFDACGRLLIEEGRVITLFGKSGCILEGEYDVPPTGGIFGDRTADIAHFNLLRWADQYKAICVFGEASTAEEAAFNARIGSDDMILVRLASLLQSSTDVLGEQSVSSSSLIAKSASMSPCPTPTEDESVSDYCHLPVVPSKQTTLDGIEEHMAQQLKDVYLSSPGKLVYLLLSLSMPPLLFANPRTHSVTPSAELVLTCRELKAGTTANERLDECDCVSSVVNRDSIQIQVRAVLGAGVSVIEDARKRLGQLEFLVPLRGGLEFEGSGLSEEVGLISLIQTTAQDVFDMTGGICIPYSVGVMIQTPRACLMLDRVARNPSISSVMFDCDALTELMFGMSKADTESLMKQYLRESKEWKGSVGAVESIFKRNPFKQLDEEGVGALLQRAVRLFRFGYRNQNPVISYALIDVV